MSDTYKTAKINFITSWAERFISAAHDVMKLIFAVLYVSLNDGPYTLLQKGSFLHFVMAMMTTTQVVVTVYTVYTTLR